MQTQTFTRTMVWESCYKCGVAFGLERAHYDELRRSRRTFYCSNGHGQYYVGKTEAEKERERADRFEREVMRLQKRDDALPEDVRWAQARALRYTGRAQRGAFWRGHSDAECGHDATCCPYPTNRFGFRSAWFDGAGMEDPTDD